MPQAENLVSASMYGSLHRKLQFELPDYTSPPLEDALAATPERYRDDVLIEAARSAAANGSCDSSPILCQIEFKPSGFTTSEVGVIIHNGALVDPRGYSVLGDILVNRFGFPVVMPIFANDLAFNFSQCNSGRLKYAEQAFPDVKKWILAGHSFGGVSVMTDLWDEMQSNTPTTASGLVLMASDVQQLPACGDVDFSGTDLPMASLVGDLDGVLNFTRFESNQQYLSNRTLDIRINGAIHASFGSYNYSLRVPLLNQYDGEPYVTPRAVWEITTAAMYQVASQLNVSLPVSLDLPTPSAAHTLPCQLSSFLVSALCLLFSWKHL